MTTAIEMSERLADLVEAASPSVVRVEARRGPPASGVVWSADVVLTANHVVEEEDDIAIGLPDGRRLEAKLGGRDPTTDLALLRVESGGMRGVEWAEPDGLRVGNLVLAISRPGRSARAVMGIVNALGDAWRTPAGGRVERYLQSDVALQPGFSGSLLVDAGGRARGIHTAGLVRGTAVAIPTPTVRRVAERLLQHGAIRRGFLGIGSYPVRLPPTIGSTLGQETALLVISVQPGGPADAAGLMLGDVLVAVDGRPVGEVGDLLAALDEDAIGRELPVQLARAGQLRDVRITVGSRPWS